MASDYKKILVIDGQGGRIGKQLIEGLKRLSLPLSITAVGTNTAATEAMLKAGADFAATGENAVIVACRTAQIIVGPIGIVIADSLYGEITPAMAVAVGQSNGQRILIPMNHCNSFTIGVADVSLGRLIEAAIGQIEALI